MKKGIRILSLAAALVLSLVMFTGCASSAEGDSDAPSTKRISMTVGIPVDENDAEWADWQSVLSSWVEDFSTYYNINLKFTKVPTEEKALKKFMKKVDSGKVACFFSSREDFINELIEKKSILSVSTIRESYSAIMEKTSDAVYTISQEDSLTNYMIPIYGTYQGLFYNRTLLKELNLPNPTSWENLLADIEGLKAAGYTPIAAGFKDEGLNYMVEEIIMSEGGTAEHSYTPSFGVISSWERAVTDLKSLENAGAFTADCYQVSFQEAVDAFLDGSAAMIVAPSTAFNGALPADDVKVVGFPNAPSGKRENSAFIGRLTHGVYVSSDFFSKPDERYSEAIAEILGSSYFGSADFYELFADESTICADVSYYESFGSTQMDNALKSLLTNAEAADWTMSERAYTFDVTVNSFRKALTGSDVTAALQEATDAEIAASEAAQAEQKD